MRPELPLVFTFDAVRIVMSRSTVCEVQWGMVQKFLILKRKLFTENRGMVKFSHLKCETPRWLRSTKTSHPWWPTEGNLKRIWKESVLVFQYKWIKVYQPNVTPRADISRRRIPSVLSTPVIYGKKLMLQKLNLDTFYKPMQFFISYNIVLWNSINKSLLYWQLLL